MSSPPPTKKLRESTEPSPTSTLQPPTTSPAKEDSVFDMLDLPLQRRILSFLISPPVEQPWRNRRDVVGAVQNCQAVCRTWRVHTIQLVNKESTPSQAIITPAELAALKTRIDALDFDDDFLEVFLNIVREKWGGTTLQREEDDGFDQEFDALDLVVENVFRSFDDFATCVGREYRKFLLVKCVETMFRTRVVAQTPSTKEESNVTTTIDPDVQNVWLEKSCPSQLLDLFWHTHMLHPVKYAQDCQILFGEMIDHEPLYSSPDEFDGSDYRSKKKFLLQFELATVGDWSLPGFFDNNEGLDRGDFMNLLEEMEEGGVCG